MEFVAFLAKCPACNQPGIRLFGPGLYSRRMNRKCLSCGRTLHTEISRWHYEIAKWVVALLATLAAVPLVLTLFTGAWVIGGLLIVALTVLNTAWMCTLHVRSFHFPATELGESASSK
jgi:hypothetical protein